MANYQYTGCVTGFSESGNTQLIAPTEPQYPVLRAANAYTERLLGVGLLSGDGGSGGGSSFDWSSLALNNEVVLDGMSDGIDEFEAELNGIIYNKDYSDSGLGSSLFGLNILDISANRDSLTFTNLTNEVLNVKLTASETQSTYTSKFISGEGVVQNGNVFLFRLGVAEAAE